VLCNKKTCHFPTLYLLLELLFYPTNMWALLGNLCCVVPGLKGFRFGMLQAQEARMREQEAERQERARLEEILNMCAEYELQERQQSRPPQTPTLHQNRYSNYYYCCCCFIELPVTVVPQ
jgi:hypothetical protein